MHVINECILFMLYIILDIILYHIILYYIT